MLLYSLSFPFFFAFRLFQFPYSLI
jgi:hypothetical protein